MDLLSTEFILAGFLVFVRVGGLIATAPFFGNGSIPVQVKIFFSLVLSMMMLPVIPVQGMILPADAHMVALMIAIFKELIVGVAMGLTGQVLFSALQISGELISMNTALTFASVVDPVNQIQQSVISQMFLLMGTFAFISGGGDAYYIGILAHSFDIVPMGTVLADRAAFIFIDMATSLFLLGVQIASPFMVVLFLMDLSFAIFGRIMPRANIFFIALPLKVGTGFLLILWVLPYAPVAFQMIFDQLWSYLDRMLHALSGG